MADAARKNAAQRAHESNHLIYGHFGTSTYDRQGQDWTFLRQYPPSTRKDLEKLDGEENDRLLSFDLLQESVQVLTHALPARSASGLGRTLKVNPSLKFWPQAAIGFADYRAASNIRNEPEKVPQNEHNLPLQKLCAFGEVSVLGSDKTQRKSLPVPVLAYVSGQDGLKLILTCLGRTFLSREVGRHEFDVPCISMSDIGIWTSDYGLIQQVTSSRNASGRMQTALAVRSESATTLLTPLLHGTAFADSASVLHPNAVLTISCKSTGGAPHADIAFQPEGTRQIAIIDIEGNWSIWRTRGKRSATVRVQHRARLLASGSLYNQYQLTKVSKGLIYPDGWHKICWLATTPDTFDRILVCNRYIAYLYDTRGEVKGEVDIRSDLDTKRQSILDVKSVASSAQECFILTSSRLLWMSAGRFKSKPAHKESGVILLASWNHFRGHNDAGLSMHLLNHSSGAFVLLSTSTSPMLTVYSASRSTSQLHTKYSISDAIPIEPLSISAAKATPRIEAVEWMEASGAKAVHKLIFKIFSSDFDGSVSEAIYQIDDRAFERSEIQPIQIIALPPRNLKIHRSERYLDAEGLDDFVVADENQEWSVNPDIGQEESVEILNAAILSDVTNHNQSICDLRSTYLGLLESTQSYMGGEKANLRQYLQQVKYNLTSVHSLQLLSELYLERPQVAEIEEDSQQLALLLKQLATDGTKNTLPMGTSPVELVSLDSRPLMGIYQDIVEGWMSTLPPSIPDRSRIFEERIFRQVALDIYLSSLAIHEKTEKDLQPSENTTEDARAQFPSSPPLLPIEDSPPPPSSQLLPSSQPPPSAQPKTSILAKYTTFTKPLSPSAPVPEIITDILGHLPDTITSNPSNYSYNEINLATLAQNSEAATQNLDARTRRKAEKTAKAKKARLQRQQQLKEVAFEQLTSVPAIASSSQMIPIREVKSSQAAPLTSSQGGAGGSNSYDLPGITLTQPERGPHGVRSVKKGKGKAKSVKIPGFN